MEQQIASSGETTTLQIKEACRLIQPSTIFNQEDVSRMADMIFIAGDIEGLRFTDNGKHRIYYINEVEPSTMYMSRTNVMKKVLAASSDGPVLVTFVAKGSGKERTIECLSADSNPLVGTVVCTAIENDDELVKSFYPHTIRYIVIGSDTFVVG